MTDQEPASRRRSTTPAEAPSTSGKAAATPGKAPSTGLEPNPRSGGLLARIDWVRVVVGLVIFGVSLFLLVVQTGDPNANTMLFSGPMGQALNIGGVVVGLWVIWSAYRR